MAAGREQAVPEEPPHVRLSITDEILHSSTAKVNLSIIQAFLITDSSQLISVRSNKQHSLEMTDLAILQLEGYKPDLRNRHTSDSE
jgi:hypothetical protein